MKDPFYSRTKFCQGSELVQAKTLFGPSTRRSGTVILLTIVILSPLIVKRDHLYDLVGDGATRRRKRLPSGDKGCRSFASDRALKLSNSKKNPVGLP